MAQTTRVIFNIPVSVKKKAAARAKREGITLTDFFNVATSAYAEGEMGLSHPELRATPAAVRRFRRAIKEIEEGKVSGPFTLEESDAHLHKLMR